MNANEHDSPPTPEPTGPSEPAETSAAEAGVGKPKRRRAPRKPRAVDEAMPQATVGEAGAPGDVGGSAAHGSVASPGPTADLREPANTSGANEPTQRRAEGGGGQGDESQDGPSGGSAVTEPSTGAAPGERSASERGSRRGRNRRRGRRGGERRGETPGLQADGEGDAAPEGVGPGQIEAHPTAIVPREPAPQVHEVFAEVLSGAFDLEPPVVDDAPPAPPPRRVLPPEPDSPKLHKVLAQAGIGSRRDLEQMIVEGRLVVNGQPAHTGQRISFGDRISLDGKPVRYRIAPPPARVLAYHKPAGEVVTHDDPQQRPTVFRRLPRLAHGKWQSVGRLDLNTEGLLLFTSSGELANQLMHPRFGVEREYAVRSLGVLDEEARARLLEGVEIDGQRAAFKSIDDGGGEGVNHWYRVVITEGRNREVRKLFEAAGHAVSRLIRIRYGSVVLPRGLKRGVWVELDTDDVRALRRLAQPQRASAGGAGGEGREPREPREPRDPRDPRDARDGRGRRGRRRRGADRGQGPRPDMGNVAMPGAEHEFDDDHHDAIDGAAIPNPLQQTYDKRAFQQARKERRDLPEDGPIPNPLQQTYDKRALQRDRQPKREYGEDGPIPNPLQQTYDKRFAHGAGPGAGGGAGPRRKSKGGKPGKGKPGPRAGTPGGQPDPMRTSVGYIGADAFLRKGGRGGGRGRGGAGGAGSGGGGRQPR